MVVVRHQGEVTLQISCGHSGIYDWMVIVTSWRDQAHKPWLLADRAHCGGQKFSHPISTHLDGGGNWKRGKRICMDLMIQEGNNSPLHSQVNKSNEEEPADGQPWDLTHPVNLFRSPRMEGPRIKNLQSQSEVLCTNIESASTLWMICSSTKSLVDASIKALPQSFKLLKNNTSFNINMKQRMRRAILKWR